MISSVSHVGGGGEKVGSQSIGRRAPVLQKGSVSDYFHGEGGGGGEVGSREGKNERKLIANQQRVTEQGQKERTVFSVSSGSGSTIYFKQKGRKKKGRSNSL